ncbi:MAG: B12-binding domain-containing radical SAM protein [Myxococcota bacterium]
MRILLVMPTAFEAGRLGLENVVWLSEPVALTSVGTAVSDRHEVRVLDLRLEREDALARELASFRPDIVGTTSMTTDAYQAKAVLRTARHVLPHVLTVVGGHHPTLSPDEFQEPYVDVLVQGEGEYTFKELVERFAATRSRAFDGVQGCRWRDPEGRWHLNPKRAQVVDLDALPLPDRSLVRRYTDRYFFTACRGMASIYTSRGCSFDCNFCAIWEFYERRTRLLSAKRIADQMEACEEDFVFVLDDNFLTKKSRLVELCEELESRRIRKFWMTQGRTDFVADNPELIARLAKNGLVGLLSGFESNDDDNLKSLRKHNSWEKNLRANRILFDNGILSTGIFMVRPDWTAEQFDALYAYINTLQIGVPLVTCLTPLPGTQLFRTYKDQLLTTDYRLFDLLHPVLPTRMPREEFYRHFARSVDALKPTIRTAMLNMVRKRPELIRRTGPGIAWFFARAWRYQRVHRDPTSFLRDEQGLLNGPGARNGARWDDVAYPGGEAHEEVVRRRPRLWHEELPLAAK